MKRDYRILFALLKQHPQVDKEELVMQFTDGRRVIFDFDPRIPFILADKIKEVVEDFYKE